MLRKVIFICSVQPFMPTHCIVAHGIHIKRSVAGILDFLGVLRLQAIYSGEPIKSAVTKMLAERRPILVVRARRFPCPGPSPGPSPYPLHR